MFQPVKKSHSYVQDNTDYGSFPDQDVYCQGIPRDLPKPRLPTNMSSGGILQPTQIWKNKFQSSSKCENDSKMSKLTTPFPYVSSKVAYNMY